MRCMAGLTERLGAVGARPRSAARILSAAVMTAVMVDVGALPASAAVLAAPIHPLRLAAPAQGRTDAVCSAIYDVKVSPGGGLTPSSGTGNTGGETGFMICAGTFHGHRVTGPGTYGNEFTYTGTCASVHTSGRYFMTVPTDAGPMHFAPMYAANSIGVVAPTNASEPGIRWTGVEVFPLIKRGNCVTAPLSEAMPSITLIATNSNS
jgi:hypothetical protein